MWSTSVWIKVTVPAQMGYYWPSMVNDCLEYAKRCQACQFHTNFIHQPPEPLHPTVVSSLFDAWGLNVVGPITPKSSTGEVYILAATDYFSPKGSQE
ncbi:hypothetical protein ACFX1T_040661 [Malus domestica]